MKARLDEKVGKLRSQVMSFANDGIQVSLSIPDTEDVKETFGSVINTVAEQQNEIQVLHTDLEVSTAESTDTQKKLLAWTVSCVQKLKDENDRLQTKLLDANKQIKNLSYNMQGFIDHEAAEESEAIPEPVEFDDVPEIKHHRKVPPTEPEPNTLFPTEEGAEVGADGLGVAPEIRKFAKYKGPEQKELAKEMYLSVKPNTLPNNVKARWRWAIRKVMATLRKKQMKVGLTRSRMDPKQTFAGRLDRIEATMLSINGDLSSQMQEMNKRIHHKVDTEVTRIDLEVSNAAGKLHMLTEDTNAQFKAVRDEIAQVDATMREFFAKVQQQSSGDTKQLKESLKALEVHVRDMVHLELDTLRSGVNHITSELDQFEGSADKLMQKIESLHTLSSTQPTYDPSKPIDAAVSDLTDLLQADSMFREARHELIMLQSSVSSVNRTLIKVDQQVNSVSQHYSRESTQTSVVELMNASQLEDLNELMQRCVGADGHVKHIDAILSSLERLCHEHDKILKDRLKIFVGLARIVREQGDNTEHLLKSQSNVDASMMMQSSPVLGGLGMTPEHIAMFEKFEHDIDELNMRVGVIEGMGALDAVMGFEEEEEEEEQEEEQEEEVKWTPPPVVPQHSIIQERVVISEKIVVDRTRSGPKEDVDVSSPDPNDNISAADTSAPFGFETFQETPTPSVTELTEPIATADNVAAAVDAAKVDSESVVKETTVEVVTPTPAPEVSIQPVLAPSPTKPKPITRKGSAMTSGSNSEKRKSSSVANLEMLEAKLRPLIERIVAASVEEKMQNYEPSADGMCGFDDEEEEVDEGGDSFPSNFPTAGVHPEDNNNNNKAEQGKDAITVTTDTPVAAATATADARKDASSPPVVAPSSPPHIPPIRSRQSSTIEFGGARIRREASRFGMSGDSGKSRNGSSKSSRNNKIPDITPYVQEIVAMKRENSRMGKTLTRMEEEKLTRDDVERMFHHLFQNNHHNEQKEESNHALHAVEKRIDTLTKEISALHASNTKAISALQAEFSETLYKVVNTAAASLDADNKESFVNTRALCLGCGRNSMVRSHPESRPMSPSFFPQISQHSSEGPDVYRAGFKLPVKNPLNPTFVLEAAGHSPGKPRAVKSAGQRMQEALATTSIDSISSPNSNFQGSSLDAVTLPRVKNAQTRPHTSHHGPRPASPGVNIEDGDGEREEDVFPTTGEGSQVMNITGGALEEASQLTAMENGSLIIQANKGYQLNIASTVAPVRATSAVKIVRGSQGRPEAEELRPIYRKGLPGKKSIRAEATYAHDRYELDMPNNILLHSNKLTNSALVPGSEAIMRPYSSQEGIRPRMVQGGGGGSKMSATTSMNTSSSTTRF